MIDQESILKVGEQLLYSTKHRTAKPISAQTTTGVRTFAIAEWNARSPSRHGKLVQIFMKDENGNVLSSTENLIEGIQDFKQKKPENWWLTYLLVLTEEKKCLKVLSMRKGGF